jgi:hypothetical protein
LYAVAPLNLQGLLSFGFLDNGKRDRVPLPSIARLGPLSITMFLVCVFVGCDVCHNYWTSTNHFITTHATTLALAEGFYRLAQQMVRLYTV